MVTTIFKTVRSWRKLEKRFITPDVPFRKLLVIAELVHGNVGLICFVCLHLNGEFDSWYKDNTISDNKTELMNKFKAMIL